MIGLKVYTILNDIGQSAVFKSNYDRIERFDPLLQSQLLHEFKSNYTRIERHMHLDLLGQWQCLNRTILGLKVTIITSLIIFYTSLNRTILGLKYREL